MNGAGCRGKSPTYLSLEACQATDPQDLASAGLLVGVHRVVTLVSSQINRLLWMSPTPTEECKKNVSSSRRFSQINTNDISLGNVRVGTVVTTWPHTRVPKPKNTHHSHCSSVSAFVEKAILPYWIMNNCKQLKIK